MRGNKLNALMAALILPLVASPAACGGGGGGDKDGDVQEDDTPETVEADMPADPLGEDPAREELLDVVEEDVREEEAPPAVTPEEYCATHFTAICSYVTLCCWEGERQELEDQGFYDPDACTSPTTMDEYTECVNSLRPSFDAGRITFDEAAAESCTTMVESYVESCPNLSLFMFDALRMIRNDVECNHVWHGNVALDGECLIDQDCTDGWCNGGRCAPLKETGEDCEENLECGLFQTCINGSCQALGQNGDDCDTLDGYDCALGLYCAVDTCRDMLSTGEACTAGQDVCEGVCVQLAIWECDDYCDGI